MTAYERLCAARKKGRPTARHFLEGLFEGFIELHGDRLYGDDPAIIGGIAELSGLPVTVIGIEKGDDTKEKIARNFGSPNPEGYRKALRLMRQAEKFHRPVVCIVDTSGAACGLGAEERGQGSAIAQNLMAMMGLKTPVLSLFIGEGGSGGALALAVADEVWMLENAVYSVISPEGAASILFKDASQVERAAESLRITAQELYDFGVVEQVIAEPEDFAALCGELKPRIRTALYEKLGQDPDALCAQRYNRFRKFGGLKV